MFNLVMQNYNYDNFTKVFMFFWGEGGGVQAIARYSHLSLLLWGHYDHQLSRINMTDIHCRYIFFNSIGIIELNTSYN